MSSPQPNILFIQVDQLAASKLRCYGNSVVDAPHIDSLAARGTVFDNTYCNFPLCAPSRFSMLSGQLASKIGVYDNGSEFPSSVPILTHYLRNLGYQTCLVGKMHFVGADQLHGFEERLTTDIYPADFGWSGDWTEVKQRHSNDVRTFTHAGVCLRNPQLEYDDEVTHRAVRKVYDLARRGDKRPFFLMVSFTHPHDPYQCREEHWRRYHSREIDSPKVGNLSDEETDPYSRRLLHQYGLDQFEPSEEDVRTARHAYYGSISYVDEQIGRVLGALGETALDQDTVVAFTSDHGDMLGERGLWYKKSFFEDSVRVPLILVVPGAHTGRDTGPVSLVDLLPTLVELAAGDQTSFVEKIEGRSLCGRILHDERDSRVVYSENLAEGATTPLLMVRDEKYKYVHSDSDPDQLFDLTRDPLELNNLAEEPGSQEARKKMEALVKAKWDPPALSREVRLSQKRRLFLAGVSATGNRSHWDYRPRDQAMDQVLRADRSYNDWAYDDVIGLHRPDPDQG